MQEIFSTHQAPRALDISIDRAPARYVGYASSNSARVNFALVIQRWVFLCLQCFLMMALKKEELYCTDTVQWITWSITFPYL